ncbi:hypothetical protein PLESTM_001861100 [Pleodorina starrii]|nr:hypothetical protein PLESTM_001861100 [Pleodorina starrii]
MWTFNSNVFWSSTSLASRVKRCHESSSLTTGTPKKRSDALLARVRSDKVSSSGSKDASGKHPPKLPNDPASLARRKAAKSMTSGAAQRRAASAPHKSAAKEHTRDGNRTYRLRGPAPGRDSVAKDGDGAAVTKSGNKPSKQSVDTLLSDLARDDPDAFVAALKAGRYTPPTARPSAAASAPPVRHAHADTATAPSNVVSIPRHHLLTACHGLKRLMVMNHKPAYRPCHVVDLIELLAGRCRGQGGAASIAGNLLQYGCRGCLTPGASSESQTELAKLLPRLVPALAKLEYDNRAVWVSLFRLMQSSLRDYSAADVAALVPALVELDSIEDEESTTTGDTAAATDTDTTTATTTGEVGSPSPSPSPSPTGFGSQQLQCPAMTTRLRELVASSGDLSGDASAGVLLGLVASSVRQVDVDQLAALMTKALVNGDLSPQGHTRVLRAAALSCDRFAEAATEVVSMLARHNPDLLPVLTERVASHAMAGRLQPHELTDVAQSLTKLRYLQQDFVAELAASTARILRNGGDLAVRDVTVALHTLAFFAFKDKATGELFAAAAARLTSRLGGMSTVSLTRLAWAYAVAGGCGLLPQEEGEPRREVESFLRGLREVLRTRAQEGLRGLSREEVGQLRFAVKIWSGLERHLAPPQLMQAVGLLERHHSPPSDTAHSKTHPTNPGPDGNSGGSTADGSDDRGSALSSSGGGGLAAQGSGGRGGSVGREGRAAGDVAAAGQEVRSSGLQRSVYSQLKSLGYRARLEKRVGNWTVDIVFEAAGGVQVAVEVDGPTHFTTSKPRLALGPSRVRDRCLQAMGLRVLPLSYEEVGDRNSVSLGALRALVKDTVRRAAGAAAADTGAVKKHGSGGGEGRHRGGGSSGSSRSGPAAAR